MVDQFLFKANKSTLHYYSILLISLLNATTLQSLYNILNTTPTWVGHTVDKSSKEKVTLMGTGLDSLYTSLHLP